MELKHNNILMYQFMDSMSYSRLTLMKDPTSKWELMAYGGMEQIIGWLDLILTKDSHIKDILCPHQLTEWNWALYDGNNWRIAGKDLGINCEYIFVKHNQMPTALKFIQMTTTS